ncbi:acyl-CoA-binding domain-containing protein 2-like isoform X2 [Cucurbita pepo subsp. pepo]|uniref:acyl-CoA-binding domain-containing protein 2-like isoform X1 n=1 Tax=Cucurbita pepo subsp. pepo TaxID=3664 RepID=UPI000C9D76F9|nr:acyl-CoA-binding domain-containing protein 2-like isoform X1 [Cucurbita pepo subsp. pepo]XP_023533275.1 acyl-CoA-binding domain-containing protein 2-like isoform X2 [Cucurbita pepo subsp. pepo]
MKYGCKITLMSLPSDIHLGWLVQVGKDHSALGIGSWGHSNVVELLVSRNADIDVKEVDGQTPLHYAIVCDRVAIAEYLVKNNASINEKDNDGKWPCDLCEFNWPFMVLVGK